MTIEEKLDQLRDDLKWLACSLIQSDMNECARAALDASMAIDMLVGQLHTHGDPNAEWDRPNTNTSPGD